jgi:hypothetical protein
MNGFLHMKTNYDDIGREHILPHPTHPSDITTSVVLCMGHPNPLRFVIIVYSFYSNENNLYMK